MKHKIKELIALEKRLEKNVEARKKFNVDLSETTIAVDLDYQVRRDAKLNAELEEIQTGIKILIHGGGTGED